MGRGGRGGEKIGRGGSRGVGANCIGLFDQDHGAGQESYQDGNDQIWRASWKSEVQSTPLLLKAWFSNQTSAEPKGRQPIRASTPPSGLSQFPPGAPQRLPARPSRPPTRRRSRIPIAPPPSAATAK